jgi:N-methylhydantoinase A
MTSTRENYRIGVDTGGTFVDAVEFNEETKTFRLAKSPTTPHDPTLGFLNAIEKLGTPLDETYLILHGTTLGVNAIIQKKGARTGIISNEGLSDIFEIGRGDVPAASEYDYNYFKPPRLVMRRHTAGVPGRMNHKGEIVQELDEDALIRVSKELVDEKGVESFALSFLHSYKNPSQEDRAREVINAHFPQVTVSASSDVVSEYREYERTSTTVLDAYIKPIVESYLTKLEKTLVSRGFRGILLVMRSDGGVMTAQTAARIPVSTVQSGPAGGVVGAIYISELKKENKMITMDIGGTSLDVCVIENGQANVVHETDVEHYPMLLTMYDIRSIGAGGGSIASVKNGLLQVGPESAGADPGPVCYGKGGQKPTVTDAAVVLGYIDPTKFLGGDILLNSDLARKEIMEQIAEPLGVSLEEAAAGIMKVTTTNSMGAIRQITVEEGRDPAEFSILSFGGAGSLFAAYLGRELGIPKVIIPNAPAAFSAWGMLMADITYEASRTHISVLGDITLESLVSLLSPLEAKVRNTLLEQDTLFKNVTTRRKVELRYLGQEHSLEVPIDGVSSIEQVREAFDKLHLKRFGHMMNDQVELVNLRARGIGHVQKPKLSKLKINRRKPSQPVKTRAHCLLTDKMKTFSVFERGILSPGRVVRGPAIVDEGVTRTILHTGQSLSVDDFGNLVIKT